MLLNIPPGAYLLSAEDAGGIWTGKVIVEK